MRSLCLTSLTIASVLVACSDGTEPDASFAVADSAGIEVVTTTEPVWGPGSPWTLRPIGEIGVLAGDEAYLFGEVGGVAIVPGGEIAVGDSQTGDVRFYTEDGEFIRRVGSRGRGPGDFQSFAWIARCGTGLVAYDRSLRRTTPISFDGDLGDPAPFVTGEENRPPYYSKCLPDGSFLAVGWGQAPPRPEGAERWMFTQDADVWRIGIGGALDTIGTYISSERIGTFNLANGSGGSGPHPFSRSVKFAGSASQLFIGGAERLQVEVRGLDGDLQRIIRGPDADLGITDAFLSEYAGADLEGFDAVVRDMVVDSDLEMPERYPAYSEILVDDLGYVWVERFVLPWSADRRWGVFAPDGGVLGHLDVDPAFRIMDVSEDRIVGVATDDLGVQRVRVYALDRN